MITEKDKIIICGSGHSIPFNIQNYKQIGMGLDPNLFPIIQNNYSIGINYWYKFGCITTLNLSVDWQFYVNNFPEIKELPLIVCAKDPQIAKMLEKIYKATIPNNSILLPYSQNYNGKDSWKKGFYHRHLSSLFVLSFCIGLGFKNIYMLGMDCNEDENGKTHFYQDLIDINRKSKINPNELWYRGIGKLNGNYRTSTYTNPTNINEKWYKIFGELKDINIYNVSSRSNITLFPKLSYQEFYNRFNGERHLCDQEKRRNNLLIEINEKMK